MLGSAVAASRLSLDYAYHLTDAAGLRVRDELVPVGFRGERPERLDPPYAYLECHIEQGPVLLRKGGPLGVVTGVQAISWQKALHGRGERPRLPDPALDVRRRARRPGEPWAYRAQVCSPSEGQRSDELDALSERQLTGVVDRVGGLPHVRLP